MASTYTTNLQLEKVTTGEKAGLWGTITNTNLEILTGFEWIFIGRCGFR